MTVFLHIVEWKKRKSDLWPWQRELKVMVIFAWSPSSATSAMFSDCPMSQLAPYFTLILLKLSSIRSLLLWHEGPKFTCFIHTRPQIHSLASPVKRISSGKAHEQMLLVIETVLGEIAEQLHACLLRSKPQYAQWHLLPGKYLRSQPKSWLDISLSESTFFSFEGSRFSPWFLK